MQNRNGLRFPLLKPTSFEGKLTVGDPFLDSGVAGVLPAGGANARCGSPRLRYHLRLALLLPRMVPYLTQCIYWIDLETQHLLKIVNLIF